MCWVYSIVFSSKRPKRNKILSIFVHTYIIGVPAHIVQILTHNYILYINKHVGWEICHISYQAGVVRVDGSIVWTSVWKFWIFAGNTWHYVILEKKRTVFLVSYTLKWLFKKVFLVRVGCDTNVLFSFIFSSSISQKEGKINCVFILRILAGQFWLFLTACMCL